MVNRDTDYAKELARGTFAFSDAEEARIEKLFVKGLGQVEIRFSWWKDGRMMMRPLDLGEDALLALIRDGVVNGVLSSEFVAGLRTLPDPPSQ